MASYPNGKLIDFPPQYNYETQTKPPGISTPGFWPRWDVHGYIQQSQSVRAGPSEYEVPTENWQTYYSPQIIDWPFSEDELGIPFDQSNLYGIRVGGPPDGDPGNMALIAVPKSLPSGYTDQPLRCRGAAQALYPRSPYAGNDAVIRTAAATVPSPAKQHYRENTPENSGRLAVLGSMVGTTYYGAYLTYALGYREGTINFFPDYSTDPEPYTVSMAISDYDEQAVDIADLSEPPDLVEVFSSSGTVPAFSTGEINVSLPYYAVPPAGGRKHFWTKLDYDNGGFATVYVGYRTDIPFHYPIVYKNKCVRGGILTAAY